PMSDAELRDAIVGPARKAGVELEEGLVELLRRDLAPNADAPVAEAAHEAGALPLLSHALLAMWERATGRRLTVAGYEAVGGVRGAVARSADDVFDSLPEDARGLAQRLFVRLVRVQDDGPSTRRRLSHAELDDLTDDDQADTLGVVLDSFVAHRLITFDATTVQLTHESLVVAWPRLRAWIDENRRELLLRQQIGDAARLWQREGRDAALLYRGSRLAAAQDLDGRALGGLAREFVQESERRERRQARTLRQTVALLAALLVIAAGGGAEALRQRSLATDQRNEALSRLVAIRSDRLRDTDPAVAAQLALAAYEITPTLEARSSLLDSSATPAVTRMHSADGLLLSVAFAGSRHLVATAGADRTVRLWDVTTPEQPIAVTNGLPGHSGTAETVAFHPTRPLLAVGGDEGARLYDVSQPAAPVDLGIWSEGSITALAFSADGARLVATSADGTVQLWNFVDQTHPVALGPPVAVPEVGLSVATLSPDGTVLAAAGSDRYIYLWDLTDPTVPVALGAPLAGPTLAVFRTAFSPDGRTVAAASADRHVYLWDLTDRAQPRPHEQPLAGPANWVHTVAFSPDGRTVAAGDSDGFAWLWRLDTGALVGTLPHPGPVTNVVFDVDGRSLYTGAADGVLRRWAIPGPVLHGPASSVYDVAWSGDVLAGASGDGAVYVWDVRDQHRAVLSARLTGPDKDRRIIGSMAISPDGRTLVAGGYDGTVWRWDISDPSRPAPIEPPLKDLPKYAESLVFSPDGRLLAAGGSEGTIALWDVGDPQRPALLTTLEGATANVYTVAFSPDGRTFAAGGVDMVVWLWDVSDPARPVRLGEPLGGPTNFVYSVAFHPAGRTLAVGSADGTVRLWDIDDRARPTPGPVLTGPNGYVIGIAFSPDGSRLAASSTDRTVWLWDLRSPFRPTTYAVLTGPGGTVQDVAYAPDGRSIAATSQDATVRIWRTEPSDAADLLCMVAGDTITPKEWGQHVPDLPAREPCADRLFARL
ncbi:MAG TPA: WD40 repeat domain-containing protein, partial [Micromonosporaceae bacterium]|nr:WD40 repeat domain-containing protein [Micromonosporaceae bacterium]